MSLVRKKVNSRNLTGLVKLSYLLNSTIYYTFGTNTRLDMHSTFFWTDCTKRNTRTHHCCSWKKTTLILNKIYRVPKHEIRVNLHLLKFIQRKHARGFNRYLARNIILLMAKIRKKLFNLMQKSIIYILNWLLLYRLAYCSMGNEIIL